MSTTKALVGPTIPKASMTRRSLNPVTAARSALAFFDVPVKRVRPLSTPNGHFQHAVDTSWMDDLRFPIGFSSAIYGAVDAIIILPATLLPGLSSPTMLPVMAGVFAALQVGWIPISIPGIRALRARKRNFNAFLLWLKARYGITVNAKQGLPRHLSNYNRSSEHWFHDDRGRAFVLRGSGSMHVTEPDTYSELTQLALIAPTPKKITSAATQLPPEAKVLFDQISQHLTVLSERDLSPESDHVVNRAVRDRDKVVALYSDLVRLGIERMDPSQAEAVINSFSTLLAELSAVVNRETKFALDALSVETTYVVSRKERKGIEIKK